MSGYSVTLKPGLFVCHKRATSLRTTGIQRACKRLSGSHMIAVKQIPKSSLATRCTYGNSICKALTFLFFVSLGCKQSTQQNIKITQKIHILELVVQR